MFKSLDAVRRTVLLQWHWARLRHFRHLAEPLLQDGIPRDDADACDALLLLQRKAGVHICGIQRLTDGAPDADDAR